MDRPLSSAATVAALFAAAVLAKAAAAAAPGRPTAEATSPPPLPDIRFDMASWSFPPGVNVSRGGAHGTTVCITGDPKKYIRVTLTVPADSVLGSGTVFYLVDTWLHGIVGGPEEYDAPKIKVSGVENMHDTVAENLDGSLGDVWLPAALRLHKSDFASDAHLDLEISVQQAAGLFCARAPQLVRMLPPPVWQYPFPPPSSANVRVTVGAVSSGKSFNPRLLSANSQFAGNPYGLGYASPQIQALLRWLRLPQLRFPGGTVGNFYDWRADAFYTQPNVTCGNHAAEHNGFRFAFDGYARAMAATNATSVLMFNVIADMPLESAARLSARVRAGIRVDWIELGNENYDAAQNCGRIGGGKVTGGGRARSRARTTAAADPHAYVAFTSQVVRALRRAPGVEDPLPIAANLDASDWTPGGWNSVVANQRVYDGFVMHPYVGVAGGVFTAATTAQILEASGVVRARLASYAEAVGRERPLLLTEWGVMGTTAGTFVQTLGEASILLAIVDTWASGDVALAQAGIHILYGGGANGLSMFGFDPATNQTVATPTGVLYRKLVEVLVGSTVLGATTDSPSLPPIKQATAVPAVDVLAVRRSTGETALVVVNKLGVEAAVSVHSLIDKSDEGRSTADDSFAPSSTLSSSSPPPQSPNSVCEVEVFSQPPLSWGNWPLGQVDALWVSQRANASESVKVPAVSVAVVTLC